MDERLARYRRQLLRWNRLTLITVLLLILAGGIVRSSGSGMGCPDWPLCFGQWIPPLYEEELPANYQEIYAERGYKDTRFNALKTWIEYLNRLLGALTGLFVLVQAVLALRLRRARLSSIRIILNQPPIRPFFGPCWPCCWSWCRAVSAHGLWLPISKDRW